MWEVDGRKEKRVKRICWPICDIRVSKKLNTILRTHDKGKLFADEKRESGRERYGEGEREERRKWVPGIIF